MLKTIFHSSVILLLSATPVFACHKSPYLVLDPSGIPKNGNESDRDAFNKIVAFWRKSFPGETCSAPSGPYFVDGPTKRPRIHIVVPKEVESLYQHSFSAVFLRKLAGSKDETERAVARDLTQLQKGVLYKRTGCEFSMDGAKPVECIDYAVPYDEHQ